MRAPAGIRAVASGSGRCGIACLWALLAETGLRLGEALGLQHRDWHTGRGDTPFVEVRPREHSHGVRVKGGAYRKLYVSDELDRLYGEYLFWLCDAGVDMQFADFDAACVFVNLAREPHYQPMRPETVYWLVRRLRRQLAGRVPERFTPHWFRHTHATALLLSGDPGACGRPPPRTHGCADDVEHLRVGERRR